MGAGSVEPLGDDDPRAVRQIGIGERLLHLGDQIGTDATLARPCRAKLGRRRARPELALAPERDLLLDGVEIAIEPAAGGAIDLIGGGAGARTRPPPPHPRPFPPRPPPPPPPP